jgi:hypothetical protein
MRKFVLACLGLMVFVGLSFADDMFKPYGDRYEIAVATNYVVAISSRTTAASVPAIMHGMNRYIANPTTTTVYYSFYSTPAVSISNIGLPLYTSSYMNIDNYFGAIYFGVDSTSYGASVRVGEITTKY